MKKLALIAAVSAFVLPLSANAAEKANEHKWYDGQTHITYEVQNGGQYTAAPFIPEDGQRMTLDLVYGGQLFLDGKAAYIIDQNGNKFFANSAPHETTSGVTYYTQDGLVTYAMANADSYTFVADAKDTNHDGYADDVDFTIQ